MTNVTTTPTTPTPVVRAGLALSAAIGLANIPFLFPIIDWGASAPPFAALLLNAAIGMVSVVCVAIAWNSGNRRAIRINAAALIVNALMLVPGFFVDPTPLVVVITAVGIVATVIAVMLTMRPARELASVLD